MPANAVSVTIVRHGETTWNAIKRIQGQLSYYTEDDGSVVPVTLSEKGRSQAEQLGQKLRTMQFTSVYASDLKRAVDTAVIATKDLNLPIIQDERLRERSRGKWEGKFESEFSKAPAEEKLGVETDDSMCDRLFSFLNEAAAENPDGNILVIGHERVITNIVVKVLKLTIKPNDIPVDHTGVLKLSYANSAWTVKDMQGISVPEHAN